MYPPDPNSDVFSGPVRNRGQGEDLEAGHALSLQHAEPNDPRVYSLLVEHYGAEIFRFVSAFLDPQPPDKHSSQVLDLVLDTFAYAAANVSHFYGSASVRGWLIRTAIERVHSFHKNQTLGRLFSKQLHSFPRRLERTNPSLSDLVEAQSAQESAESAEFESRLWDLYSLLPEKQRLLVLLRFVFHIETREIGQILNISRDRMLRYLIAFRDDLSDGRLETSPQKHPLIRKQILKAWEGILEMEPSARLDLRRHLSECPDCSRYTHSLEGLDNATSKAFNARWQAASFEPGERDRLANGFDRRRAVPSSVIQAASSLRYGAWIGLAVVLFIGIAWLVNQSLPIRDQPLQARTSTAKPLPAPIEIEARIISSPGEDQTDHSQGNYDYNLNPRLSADGRWVVYFSDQLGIHPSARTRSPEISLFDRQTGETALLSLPAGSDLRSMQNSPPGISADGRWIVFSGYVPGDSGLVLNGEKPDKSQPGILLFDREADQLQLVDLTPDGKPSNGSSIDPVISADGDWIAFWSDAQDIAAGSDGPCATAACLDLFLLNRPANQVQRIPVGRNPDAGQRQLSLSADGRMLALSLLADDLIAQQIELLHMVDVYLYDRISGDFSPVNYADDGSPGNDATFDPHLSANGRVVAFSSFADNLVLGDNNGVQDVFVRELDTGSVERVSVSSTGTQGYMPSGALGFGDGIGGTQGVSISADGRFIAFTSFAGLQEGSALLACTAYQPLDCSLIYVHDRQTGRTVRVAGRMSQRAYLSPGISADGLQISYLEVRSCDLPNEEHACSDVWIYDQNTRWTSAVSRLPSSNDSPEWVSSLQILTRGTGIPPIGFSGDGQAIATGNNDGSVDLLSTADGKLISTLKGKPESSISSIAFSPDGEMLAAGAFPGVVKVWSLSDSQLRYTLNGHPEVISSLRYSNDGNLLVVGAEDAIWVWQLKGTAYHRIAAFKYPKHFVLDVALSANAQWLAVAGADQTVWIQKIPSGELALRLGGQSKPITTIAFSPDGNYLAVGSQDQSVNLWDTSDLNQQAGGGVKPPRVTYLHTFWHPDEIRKLKFSADGYSLLTLAADKRLRSWNVANKSFQSNLFADVYQFSSSLAGGTLVVGEDGQMIRLWRGASGIAEPRLFERAPSEQVKIALDTPPVPGSGEARVFEFRFADADDAIDRYQSDLYQAGEAADFPLQVPAYLPPGVAFHGAYVSPKGAVILAYDYLTGPVESQKYATILLCQRTLKMDESACGGWIGKNAVVENVSISEQAASQGEYVSGDWTTDVYASQNLTGKIVLQWDPDMPTRWLRWQSGTIVSTLVAKSSVDVIPFSKDDLLAIASSLLPLTDLSAEKPITIPYQIQEGDTCQGIASQFGTTIRDLIDLNGLSEGCETILAGRTLIVPLPQERKTIAEADLNCDGQLERLQVIGYSRSYNQGLVLQTRGWNGLYETAWHYTFDQIGSGSFMLPELIRPGGCERFVAVDFVGIDPGIDTFKVFRWDGYSMTTVLDAKGSAGLDFNLEGAISMLSVKQRSIDPASGACQMTTVAYGWDGRTFVELGARSGLACTP